MIPFVITFMSDEYEFIEDAKSEAAGTDVGFRLFFIMDAVNCPP